MLRRLFSLSLIVTVPLLANTVFAQQRYDPIGPLKKVSVFDRAQNINVGRTETGKIVCYFREEGGSHTLDIGVSAEGAFLRLETGDTREVMPSAPLRIFAGKQIAKGQYATNDFAVLQAYGGQFHYYIPRPSDDNFVVIAKDDPAAFLAMVARARTEFVVVQSLANPKDTNIVAIYKFTGTAIPALLACAKDRAK